MFLHEVFPPECIKVNLESGDKDEVFEEMVDFFCQAQKLDTREEILQAIREREEKMSTGIQKGIAIPHGKSNAVDRVYGVIGISKNGIDYDALDGEPVYLLFLIIAPQQNTEQQLKVLKRLAELMENPQFYIDLQSQKDAQGAYTIINKYEDILAAPE